MSTVYTVFRLSMVNVHEHFIKSTLFIGLVWFHLNTLPK